MRTNRTSIASLLFGALLLFARTSFADDGEQVLSIDHFVPHVSTAPAAAGHSLQLYVRERVQAKVALGSPSFAGRVVLFVHGATIPSEVVFDAQYEDYSWMAYLAQQGFDVFGADVTGYGQSGRPAPMDDPCNVDPAVQQALIPIPLGEACSASYTGYVTTFESDRDDVAAVVDYVKSLRHVDKVNLIGWSRGGPRAGGYAALHPESVDKLVLLAPVRSSSTAAPSNTVMGFTTRQAFDANWDNQIGCPDQYDPGIRPPLWNQLLDADSTGAAWGPGGYRAPFTFAWNWADLQSKIQAPTLLISGDNDKQVPQDSVRALYDELQTPQKAFAALACSSHLAAWETRHNALFDASSQWMVTGTVNGERSGTFRLGD